MKNSSANLLCLLILSASLSAAGDVVIDWNNALLDTARTTRISPPEFSRAAAITHLAIHDAVNGITPMHRSYHMTEPAPAGASVEAAASAAAFTTAMALFTNSEVQENVFVVLHQTILAAIPEEPGKADGIAWGQSVGHAFLQLRSNDGSRDTVHYDIDPAPGVWHSPTPPLLPAWGKVRPFAIPSGAEFRPHPPPQLASSSYANELAIARTYGADNSTVRTPNQTEIAHFWADGLGTETPPGHWNRIAQGVAMERNFSLAENARLFALLNMALADAAIASWDAKYTYNLWRPITAIREAGTDGNAETEADPDWTPLIATPPFPECTSGHSTFSRAAATILAAVFGSDQVAFTTASDGLPGVTRSYESFSQAADEAGISRIYGGIHFPTGNISGQACGYAVANHALVYFLQPLSTTRFAAVGRVGTDTRLTLTVEPGRQCVIRASSDLKTWEEIATLSSETGLIQFSDVNAPEHQIRFYNAVLR